jgi:D-sedoheptulose 7-phosphate isomerase
MKEDVRKYIDDGAEARKRLDHEEIYSLGKRLHETIKNGNKLITFGNGGSAADAQHIAAELSGKFMFERRSLPAIALTTNTSVLTAIGNDYSYDDIFARQVEGLVNRGDFVIGISTSGNSPNVIKGLATAKSKGAFTLALTGRSGGKMKDLANHTLRVESDKTPIIQEVHIAVGHLLCMIAEEELVKDEGGKK